MFVEYLIPHKHTLKFLYKSKHFPSSYKRKREWVFFSEHSVYNKGSFCYSPSTVIINITEKMRSKH